MLNIKIAPSWITLEGEMIQKVERFKNLEQWMDNKLSEKEALMSRINNMNLAYRLTMNTYNKKISINAKLKHF